MTLEQKYAALITELRACNSLLIAFSGGVDSTFLVAAALEALGPDKVVALTATSPTYPEVEFAASCRLAAELGVRQVVVESNELEIPGFIDNPPDRCYHCKKELLQLCFDHAARLGLANVADGANCDDLGDYRPGRRAAAELGIRSPLIAAGLTKDEIRALSRRLKLPTAEKQPFACLASRFPYGTVITAQRLQQIDACEAFLRTAGFRNYRVRFHDEVARIEVGEDELARFCDPQLRAAAVAACKSAGFAYVTLDLQGYRSGSMNETLSAAARNAP